MLVGRGLLLEEEGEEVLQLLEVVEKCVAVAGGRRRRGDAVGGKCRGSWGRRRRQ